MDQGNPQYIQLSENPQDVVVMQKKLGQGGFGAIYKARWRGVDLALKRAKKSHGGQSLRTEVAVLKELHGFPLLFKFTVQSVGFFFVYSCF